MAKGARVQSRRIGRPASLAQGVTVPHHSLAGLSHLDASLSRFAADQRFAYATSGRERGHHFVLSLKDLSTISPSHRALSDIKPALCHGWMSSPARRY